MSHHITNKCVHKIEPVIRTHKEHGNECAILYISMYVSSIVASLLATLAFVNCLLRIILKPNKTSFSGFRNIKENISVSKFDAGMPEKL